MNSFARSSNTSPYIDDTLTPEVISFLKNTLTKLSLAILNELYQHPRTQHKVLAANVHTSATSLSNMLAKLEALEPPLLITERIGRSKYYSLTELAESYVVKEIIPKSSKIHAFSSPQDDPLTEETLEILSQFQRAAGSEWILALDDMLSGKAPGASNIDELNDLYTDFIANVKQLKMLNRLNSIGKINIALGQIILVKRLETCIDNDLKKYYALEPLLKLEKYNFQHAFLLIDYIFSKIEPGIFSMPDLPLSFKNLSITDTEYAKLYIELTEMINEYKNYQYNKFAAITHWQNVYCSPNASIIYFIAEKCYYICRGKGN